MVLVISSKIWAIEKTPGGIIILNMSTINENHMVYDSWDMEHNRQNFFSFWTIFCTFTPASVTTQRCKMKKTPGDIIILHKCTINDNHMIYGSWDINYNRQIFFVILGHFLPFYPPNSPKNENIKKMKTSADIIILHKCTKTNDHRLYCSWDMVFDGCNCCFLFWANFCPFTPLTAQRWKFQKTEKNTRVYHHFTQVCQKSLSYAILFPRYGTWHM